MDSQLASFSGEADLSQPQTTPLTGVDAAVRGGTTVEGVLQFVGGTTLDAVTAAALFRGSRNASLFYGGLLGQGEVKQIAGVNQLFHGNGISGTSTGLLLAITTKGDTSLMAGPSLQFDTITAGFGLVARKRASDNKLVYSSGVALALDLSQLLGGKQNTKTISFENSTIGGVSSDTIADSIFPVIVTLKLGPDITTDDWEKLKVKNPRIILTRTKSFPPGADAPVPVPNPEVFTYPVPEPGKELILKRLVPRGMYAVTSSLPAEYGVYDISGNINPALVGEEFQIGSNLRTKELTYVIKKK
ncbi:MAG: hypothetical protein QM758_06340 [Armatimonas sp.]